MRILEADEIRYRKYFSCVSCGRCKKLVAKRIIRQKDFAPKKLDILRCSLGQNV